MYPLSFYDYRNTLLFLFIGYVGKLETSTLEEILTLLCCSLAGKQFAAASIVVKKKFTGDYSV